MSLDALALEPQFLDHLAPVWLTLPAPVRGRFLVEPTLVERARAAGIEAFPQPRPAHVLAYPPARHDGPPALVASYGDMKEARRLGYGPFAFLEHGAGQSYGQGNRNGSYAGGPDRADNELILVPSETCAATWRNAYPAARVVIVGCPKLDSLPRREYSIGVEWDTWRDFAAVIQTHLRTFGTTNRGERVCVAHAIADASPIEPERGSSRATLLSPNTTGSGTSSDGQKPPLDPTDLGRTLTAAVKLATSECTPSSKTSCLGSATSAGAPIDWKSLSDGIRLRKIGSSTLAADALTLEIPTTSFGFVSLVMSSTTVRATSPGILATLARPSNPVVALSWHWPAPLGISGYAGTAFGDYVNILPALAERFDVIGHAHPKGDWPQHMARKYAKAGIPFVAEFDDVCRRADVYVCDNSSTLPEFAATGRPVVLLNHRNWSRKGNIGGRFWDWAHLGINVDRAEDLIPAIEEALEDAPQRQADREDALAIVYGVRSGGADVAARAITDWLASKVEVAA